MLRGKVGTVRQLSDNPAKICLTVFLCCYDRIPVRQGNL